MTDQIDQPNPADPNASHPSPAAETGRANAALSLSTRSDIIAAAHTAFVGALALTIPPIPLHPEPVDFTARGLHARLILSVTREYLLALVNDAADNSTGAIDRADLTEAINASLNDLAGDIDGSFDKEAKRIEDDRYDGCPRGPFYRRRG